jgi:flagellar biosynthesis component FlhA
MDLEELTRILSGDVDIPSELPRASAGDKLPDLDTRTHIIAVLRLLLHESIPVTDIELVLRIFAGSSDLDPISIAEQCRYALREHIPATHPSRSFVRLSDEIEEQLAAGVVVDERTRYLSLDTAWASRLHAALSNAADVDPERLTIVVAHEDVRPFVRHFFSQDVAAVGVVTERELGDIVDLTDAPVIELPDPEDI